MSSDLSIELDRLNKDDYVQFYFTSGKYESRTLELIGVVPIGTFCYVCGNKATHDFNKHRVCISCFDKLNTAIQVKRSQVNKDDKLFYYYDDIWISKKHSGRLCSTGTYSYSSLNPKEMLKIAFLGHDKVIEGQICLSCKRSISSHRPPYERDKDTASCFENNYACIHCTEDARLYFDLKLTTYMFLKLIFFEEINIAKYAVLYHHKLKLRNCKNHDIKF